MAKKKTIRIIWTIVAIFAVLGMIFFSVMPALNIF